MKTESSVRSEYHYDAFISYSSVDKDWVKRLVSRLSNEGLKIWYDEEIKPGDAIHSEIQTAIAKSKRLVFVISKSSVSAEFPLSEIDSILYGDPLNKNRRLIPLRIDEVEMPAFLAHFSSIQTVKNHDWFQSLVKACSDELDPTKRKARIFVVDDHPICIEGIKKLTKEQEDMRFVGGAENAMEAIEQIAQIKPDVVVLDITLKDRSGVDLIKKLRASHPNMQILVYSMHDENVYAERCLRAGAMGYVMKGEPSTRVLQGLRQVVAGSFFFSASLLGSIVSGGGPRGGSRVDPARMLSDRQLEIFEMVGRGFDSRSIAEKQALSTKTVDAHKANIRQKLGLTSARELLMEAVRWVEK